jgi:hypothetical protein
MSLLFPPAAPGPVALTAPCGTSLNVWLVSITDSSRSPFRSCSRPVPLTGRTISWTCAEAALARAPRGAVCGPYSGTALDCGDLRPCSSKWGRCTVVEM